MFVLVVTREIATHELVRQSLEANGWWVTSVEDRETALRSASDQAPQLVLVDGEVPNADELCRIFASRHGGPGSLLLAPQEGSPEAAGGADADEILRRPPVGEEIVAAAERLLSQPHPVAEEPARPAGRVLSAQDIFGDMLLEMEGEQLTGEGVTVSGAAAPSGTSPPAPAAVAPAPESDRTGPAFAAASAAPSRRSAQADPLSDVVAVEPSPEPATALEEMAREPEPVFDAVTAGPAAEPKEAEPEGPAVAETVVPEPSGVESGRVVVAAEAAAEPSGPEPVFDAATAEPAAEPSEAGPEGPAVAETAVPEPSQPEPALDAIAAGPAAEPSETEREGPAVAKTAVPEPSGAESGTVVVAAEVAEEKGSGSAEPLDLAVPEPVPEPERVSDGDAAEPVATETAGREVELLAAAASEPGAAPPLAEPPPPVEGVFDFEADSFLPFEPGPELPEPPRDAPESPTRAATADPQEEESDRGPGRVEPSWSPGADEPGEHRELAATDGSVILEEPSMPPAESAVEVSPADTAVATAPPAGSAADRDSAAWVSASPPPGAVTPRRRRSLPGGLRFWLGMAAGLVVFVLTTLLLDMFFGSPSPQVVEPPPARSAPARGDLGSIDLQELVDRELAQREAELRESLLEEERRLQQQIEELEGDGPR